MIWYIIAIAACILNAVIDADKIRQNVKISHAENAGWYAIVVILCFHFTLNWQYCVRLLALRKVVFDISLNILRNKNPFYYSLTTGSVIDKFLLKVFRNNVYVMYAFFVLIIITSLLKL